MKLTAMGDRVIVKVWEAPTRRGKVELPPSAQEKPQVGEVVSVGELVKQTIAEHEVVVFAKYSGVEMEIPGPDGNPVAIVTILAEADILARWEDPVQPADEPAEPAMAEAVG